MTEVSEKIILNDEDSAKYKHARDDLGIELGITPANASKMLTAIYHGAIRNISFNLTTRDQSKVLIDIETAECAELALKFSAQTMAGSEGKRQLSILSTAIQSTKGNNG